MHLSPPKSPLTKRAVWIAPTAFVVLVFIVVALCFSDSGSRDLRLAARSPGGDPGAAGARMAVTPGVKLGQAVEIAEDMGARRFEVNISGIVGEQWQLLYEYKFPDEVGIVFIILIDHERWTRYLSEYGLNNLYYSLDQFSDLEIVRMRAVERKEGDKFRPSRVYEDDIVMLWKSASGTLYAKDAKGVINKVESSSLWR